MWDRMSRDDRIEAIRAGVRDNMSTSQIAAEIGGCSRNSIIGLAHRAKITLCTHQGGRAPEPKAERKAQPSKPRFAKDPPEKEEKSARAPAPLKAALVIRKPVIVDVEPVYEFPDAHYQVHLEDVKSGQCRRPTWNDDKRPGTEVYFYCGKPVKSGSAYCWHCHKKMYDGMPAQRREKSKASERLTRRGELA